VIDQTKREPHYAQLSTKLTRYDTSGDDHYSQTGDLFKLMDASQRDQLAGNIANGLAHATDSVKERMLAQFSKADSDYASRVTSAMAGLG